MRAVGYLRQPDGPIGSLADFEAVFADYCRENMHQPVATFAEQASSASPGPAHQRLLDYMRDPRYEFLVAVPSARHLGDDLESVVRGLVELEGLGARVACIDDDFPDPLQNAFQTLGVKGVSRTRSRRIKESMSRRASRGQALGKPLFGYRIGPDGRLAVDKQEAAVVELIFRLYTKEDQGLRLIAQHLNERAIRTRRGSRWNTASINDILRNPAYMGTYTRFDVRVPKAHEAVVPSEVFQAAQEIARSRRPVGRVARPEPFLLSGIAYCAECGNKMMGVTKRQSWKRKDGRRGRETYRYYQCQSRNNQSVCSYHTWRALLLENQVLSQLRLALAAAADPEIAAARNARALDMWQERLRHAERRFLGGARRAARAEITLARLGTYLADLDALRGNRPATGGAGDPGPTLARWESLDVEGRRRFLTERLARVVVGDETVELEL